MDVITFIFASRIEAIIFGYRILWKLFEITIKESTDFARSREKMEDYATHIFLKYTDKKIFNYASMCLSTPHTHTHTHNLSE